VDSQTISEVSPVGPVFYGRMLVDEIQTVLKMDSCWERGLSARIMPGGDCPDGADRHTELRTVKPTAVFMFAGPSGVGRRDGPGSFGAALWREDNLITINMSEYQESHGFRSQRVTTAMSAMARGVS